MGGYKNCQKYAYVIKVWPLKARRSNLTLFLPGSGMTLIAGVGPLWPRIDFSHSEAFRRCPYAQKWLESNFLIFSCPKTPKTALYFFIFCHSSCRSMIAKNENFQAKIGQNLKILDTWELYTSKESLENVQFKFITKKSSFKIFHRKIKLFLFESVLYTFLASFWDI